VIWNPFGIIFWFGSGKRKFSDPENFEKLKITVLYGCSAYNRISGLKY